MPRIEGGNQLCAVRRNINGGLSCYIPRRSGKSAKPSVGFYDGLAFVSPTLLRQAIKECLDSGLKTELDVSKHLTAVYGCALMEYDALAEHHCPMTHRRFDSNADGW